jgi:hypothetical protein
MNFKFNSLMEDGNQKECYKNIYKDFSFGSLEVLDQNL